jgi:hypothetical protein
MKTITRFLGLGLIALGESDFADAQTNSSRSGVRRTTRLLILLSMFCWSTSLIGSPAEDLSSPTQEVRDAAARILRSTYTAPSRTNWEAVVTSITNGMTKMKLLELLSPYHVTPVGGLSSGGSYNQSYRLDDAWMLNCWFRDEADIVVDRALTPYLRGVWVAPPTNFTGVWTVYFVNGQKSADFHCDAGKYHGECITYTPDGSKCVVQHYDHHVAEGADTGYFASGRTNYHGIYKGGKQVGIWIWYNEDGSVKSTKDYSE